MLQNEQDVPSGLRPQAEAALSWINKTQGQSFELTGLVDSEKALTAETGMGYELGLVLCDGEICTREQVWVQPLGNKFEFSLVDAERHEIPPLLDPPEGLRRNWLEQELNKHEFVLLLFYRGLW